MQDEQQQTGPQDYKYWGFISYSHADEKWADWLHKALETYSVPKQLVGKPTKFGPIPRRAFPIFRDRDELPSSADLGDKLTAALTGSRYLIVICSPRSVASQWVNEEIKTFKSLGREAQVLCLIVDGEPYASHNPQLGLEECFPEPVRYQVDENRQLTDVRTEPIAADARKGKDGKANARLKLLSGMFNVNFSDLKQRDHERAQKRLQAILAGVMVLFVVFLVLGVQLFIQRNRAIAATKEANEQRALAVENEQRAVANEERAVENEKLAVRQADRARKAEGEAREQQKRAEANAEEANKQRDRAERNLEEAERQRKLAEQNAEEAKRQQKLAEENEAEAKRNFEVAEEQRKLAEEQRLRAVGALSISDFNAAARLVEEGNQATAIAYLSRSLFVNPENSSTEARLISLLSGENWSLPLTAALQHSAPVNDVDYSSDGKHIVTAAGSAAQLWSVATGQPVGEPMQHRNTIRSVRFSPDGQRVVTASDPNAQVWDLTGKPVGASLNHDRQVEIARFSRDGSKVVTCSGDRSAKVWEAATGKELASVSVDGLPASVDFNPDGSVIVVAYDRTAQMYDATSGAALGAKMEHPTGGIFATVFGPNGKYLATASGDSSARVWDAKTGAPVTDPLKHEARVVNVVFSPSGLHIVSSSEDDTARVWNVQTGAPVGQPLRHDLDVNMADVSPNGRWVVTASEDRTAKIWSLSTGELVLEPIKFNGPVKAARFSHDGRRVAIGSEDQTAQVWTCLSGQPKSEPLSHGRIRLNWAAFSSDAKYAVTCGHDYRARIWDVSTGQMVTDPLVQGDRAVYAEFSPDDQRLLVVAAGSGTSYLQVWDVKSGQPVGSRIASPVGRINSAQFNGDGSSILLVGRSGATVLNTTNGQPRFESRITHRDARANRAILSGRFNADFTQFVTTGEDKAARIWDAKTGAPQGEPFLHKDAVTDATFSRDGKFLATGSKDRTAIYWEIATGKAMTEPMQHDRSVNSVDLSADGIFLIAACDDSTVRVWRTATGQSGAEPLQHQGAVQSARFSEDGLLVVSYGSENSAYVWETASWKLVTDPLTHSGQVNSAVFSKDSAFVITSSNDETAKIWQISIPGDAPQWLTRLAETVGGFRMAGSGGGTELVLNPWEGISQVREEMKRSADAVYAEWGEWFLADRAERPVAPYASQTVEDYVDSKVDAGDAASLEEALDLQPDHALALARLGISTTDDTLADFYTELAVTYEPDNYHALWLRGAALHRLQDFSDAWPYLERAAKLDPRSMDNLKDGGGAEFTAANQAGNVSQGWLPAGWVDNNRDKSISVTYTQLSDGPPGANAAVKVTAKGQAGRAEILGPRFIARSKAGRVIEFWARGPRTRSINVYARSFSGRKGDRPQTYASEILRMDEKWKLYRVNVRPAQDIAAEVVIQVPSSSAGSSVDLSDIIVRVQ